VWTDKDGVEWIQVGASKISKKLYDTRELTRQICSVCNRDVSWSNNPNDVKFFNKTGKCYDCVIEEEHQMRLDGTFETYEKIKVIKNQRSYLTELKQKIEESVNWLKNKSNKIEYLNEDGTKESWTDVSREEFISEAENDLGEVNKSLVLCNVSIEMLETELNELKTKQSTHA
jgi:predicted nuclease with TOPRIM domain